MMRIMCVTTLVSIIIVGKDKCRTAVHFFRIVVWLCLLLCCKTERRKILLNELSYHLRLMTEIEQLFYNVKLWDDDFFPRWFGLRRCNIHIRCHIRSIFTRNPEDDLVFAIEHS